MDREKRKVWSSKLRARRQAAQLTLCQFAEKSRADIGMLSRWETGKRVPSQTTVERIEAVLLSVLA